MKSSVACTRERRQSVGMRSQSLEERYHRSGETARRATAFERHGEAARLARERRQSIGMRSLSLVERYHRSSETARRETAFERLEEQARLARESDGSRLGMRSLSLVERYTGPARLRGARQRLSVL